MPNEERIHIPLKTVRKWKKHVNRHDKQNISKSYNIKPYALTAAFDGLASQRTIDSINEYFTNAHSDF